MFITLTIYGGTNKVKVNVGNICYYSTVKTDAVVFYADEVSPEHRRAYTTGIYFQNNRAPLVVAEDIIVVDKLIREALFSRHETVV